MTLHDFIVQKQLQTVDAVVLRKKVFGMVDHYAIYMGVHGSRHVFIANYTKGVQVIPDEELSKFLSEYVPERLERFTGTEQQRIAAYMRAKSKIGQRAYDLISNNCEHFKNWVHKGVHRSEQVETVAKGAAVVAGAAVAVGLIGLLLNSSKSN